MPFGIVAYALRLFSWTTFLETAVYAVMFTWEVNFYCRVLVKHFLARMEEGVERFTRKTVTAALAEEYSLAKTVRVSDMRKLT